jgi:hypothetical protein
MKRKDRKKVRMSSKESEPSSNDSKSSDKTEERKKESSYRDIYLKSPVTVEFSGPLREQRRNERKEDDSQHKKQLRWTKIGAGLLFAYTTLTFFQWRATLNVMHADQRAWIIPTQDNAVLAEGQPIGQMFRYINKGKTPARRVVSEFVMISVHENDKLSFDYGTSRSSFSHIGAVFADVHIDQGVPLLAESASGQLQQVLYQGDIEKAFKGGQIMFLVYGKIDYWDVFGTHHWVHYCTMTFAVNGLSHSSPVSRQCSAYTDTDDH